MEMSEMVVPNITVQSLDGPSTLISIDGITELVIFSLILTVSTSFNEIVVMNSEKELGSIQDNFDSLCTERSSFLSNQRAFYCHNSKPGNSQVITVRKWKQEYIENVSIITTL